MLGREKGVWEIRSQNWSACLTAGCVWLYHKGVTQETTKGEMDRTVGQPL